MKTTRIDGDDAILWDRGEPPHNVLVEVNFDTGVTHYGFATVNGVFIILERSGPAVEYNNTVGWNPLDLYSRGRTWRKCPPTRVFTLSN